MVTMLEQTHYTTDRELTAADDRHALAELIAKYGMAAYYLLDEFLCYPHYVSRIARSIKACEDTYDKQIERRLGLRDRPKPRKKDLEALKQLSQDQRGSHQMLAPLLEDAGTLTRICKDVWIVRYGEKWTGLISHEDGE